MLRFAAVTLLVPFAVSPSLSAQTRLPAASSGRGANIAERTTVKFEILIDRTGVGFQAQRWAPVFEKLGASFRIRQQTSLDKVGIEERKVGTLRFVTVTGRLHRSGKLLLADRTFERKDAAKLKEWVDELKVYGKQGAPQGKPLWGLTKSQFGIVYDRLSGPVAVDVADKSLEAALPALGLPRENPYRLSADARAWLKSEFPAAPKVRQRIKGVSLGTALALLLNDYGLGFRPLRTPAGRIELAIEPLKKSSDAWPIGWELKLSRPKSMPELFKLVPVQLDDVKLLDVFAAVEAKGKVPILLDHYRIEAANIRLEKIKVSHAPRRSSFSLLLQTICGPNKLSRKYRIDERGRPFVWITARAF